MERPAPQLDTHSNNTHANNSPALSTKMKAVALLLAAVTIAVCDAQTCKLEHSDPCALRWHLHNRYVLGAYC